jgi:hypothetical protein
MVALLRQQAITSQVVALGGMMAQVAAPASLYSGPTIPPRAFPLNNAMPLVSGTVPAYHGPPSGQKDAIDITDARHSASSLSSIRSETSERVLYNDAASIAPIPNVLPVSILQQTAATGSNAPTNLFNFPPWHETSTDDHGSQSSDDKSSKSSEDDKGGKDGPPSKVEF